MVEERKSPERCQLDLAQANRPSVSASHTESSKHWSIGKDGEWSHRGILENLMSDDTREIVVEYRFHCFCGAPIVTIEKTVTCATCGETLGYYASTFPVRRIDRHEHEPDRSSCTARDPRRSAPWGYQTLTSIESDFEDHASDGPHGGFIVFLLLPVVALIVLLGRSCARSW